LAECANSYRTYLRQISEARDPKALARRKKILTSMRRQAAIEAFVIAEVMPLWRENAKQRTMRH
jgi:hypothetical protein